MLEPWATKTEPSAPESSAGPVTLVKGSTFSISGRSGDIRPDLPEGIFFLDTRLLSRWHLRVDGEPIHPLAVHAQGPDAASFVSRARPVGPTGSLLVVRRRSIGRGMREELSIRHHGETAREVSVELICDVDFADLFEVKLRDEPIPVRRRRRSEAGGFTFEDTRGPSLRSVRLTFSEPPTMLPDRATWRVTLEPGAEWHCCCELEVSLAGVAIEPLVRCGKAAVEVEPDQGFATWRARVPDLRSDHARLDRAWSRSVDDLGSLRMFDPAHPAHPVVAAGAPWFMTLFGRDSLITAWATLLIDPDIALGVLEALARLQGRKVDPATEEQPGRILHEVRFGESASMSLGDGHVYYGTIDATALFVMLLGELGRWGHKPRLVDALIPAADRALAWIDELGDRDGDGYVEYERMTPKGLRNQGWKDSWDGVPAADGRLPDTPIALCEVQGYVYAAYLARASLARAKADTATEERYLERAATLKEAFERDFWLPERGWYAIGLDAEKRPIDALTSNIGHCLWTGIADEAHAREAAAHLMSEAMFSGWGVRTLATTMERYDPLSYHNGSVWPHDNAILAAGLMRYGLVAEAHRVIQATLDVAAAADGRLPELFSGVARDDIGIPVAYPTSCSPQAWAAASPLLFVRTLLGLEPDMPAGRLVCTPRLPATMEQLSVSHLPLAGRRVSVHVSGGEWHIEGLDADTKVVSGAGAMTRPEAAA